MTSLLILVCEWEAPSACRLRPYRVVRWRGAKGFESKRASRVYVPKQAREKGSSYELSFPRRIAIAFWMKARLRHCRASERTAASRDDRGILPPGLPAASSCNQADHRHKQCRPDNRPDDWKAFAADAQEKKLRQVKRIGKPNSYDRANETQRDRHKTSAMAVADNCAAN
jgi:hypothetical protein